MDALHALTLSTYRCARPACPDMVPAEYIHLGMGLCEQHQEDFDNNVELMFKGRQRMFRTPQDLWQRAVTYFEECDRDKKPYTTSGCSLALGTTWNTLLSYSKGMHGPAFAQAATQVRHMIEAFAERNLYGEHKQGARFHLMAKFGYAERSEVVNNGGGNAAPQVYIPHNGRDQVDLVPDPDAPTSPAVGGPSTQSSERQSAPVEEPRSGSQQPSGV